MDIIIVLIILLLISIFICHKKGFVKSASTNLEEYFYNKKFENFFNFKTLNRPPMSSPYQCQLNFNCTQYKDISDKHESVCKKCVGFTYPDNLVMARTVGSTGTIRKIL